MEWSKRLHVICGMCGCKDDLSYKIKKDWIVEHEAESNESVRDGVVIYCGNCSTNTSLDEVIKEEE